MLAAHAAHIPVLVTVSEYTKKEDFREATIVVDSLGDPQGPKSTVLASRLPTSIVNYVTLEDMAGLVQNEFMHF
jgi:hypothetical protein